MLQANVEADIQLEADFGHNLDWIRVKQKIHFI